MKNLLVTSALVALTALFGTETGASPYVQVEGGGMVPGQSSDCSPNCGTARWDFENSGLVSVAVGVDGLSSKWWNPDPSVSVFFMRFGGKNGGSGFLNPPANTAENGRLNVYGVEGRLNWAWYVTEPLSVRPGIGLGVAYFENHDLGNIPGTDSIGGEWASLITANMNLQYDITDRWAATGGVKFVHSNVELGENNRSLDVGTFFWTFGIRHTLR